MTPRRQGRGTLRGLVSDPWRKLVALALAIVLWLFLDRQITSSVTLECTLQLLDSEKMTPERTQESYLYARIRMRDYSRDLFVGPDNEEIRSVKLTFEGPSHVIESIQPGEQFTVQAQPRQGQKFFEFDAGMLDGDRQMLEVLKSMEPPRVTAVFKRNTSKEINLSFKNVDIKYPPAINGANYEERLDLAKASFAPKTVTLFGTDHALDPMDPSAELFEADLSDPEQWLGDRIETRLTLLPRLTEEDPIRTAGATVVTIPLKPTFEEVTVEVRVLLDLGLTNFAVSDFEPVEPKTIVLQASGQLMTHMGRTPQEQQAWAREHLVIDALLPKEATLAHLPAISGKLRFIDEIFEEDKDYVVGPILITLTPARQ